MPDDIIRRLLERRAFELQSLGLALMMACGPCSCGMLAALPASAANGFFAFALVCLMGLMGPTGLGMVIWGWFWLYRIAHHPDIQRLWRYGPPEAALRELTAEVDAGVGVTYLGDPARIRAVLSDGPPSDVILITPSWLVYFPGSDLNRVDCMRLDSLVWVYRDQGRPAGNVVLHDRYGVRLEIPGEGDDLSRLIAEVVARVPWALTHFDEELGRRWRDEREQIVAEADRRRVRGPPTTTEIARPRDVGERPEASAK